MPQKTPFLEKISTKIASISIIFTLFFVFMVFGVLLPVMERELMESRQDSLQALVDVAHNLINEYEERVQSGELSLDDAKQRFILRLNSMRFQNHDYFWVQNNLLPYPSVITHPADPSLNGKVMDDPRFNKAFEMQFSGNGKRVSFPEKDKNLFQAAAEVVLESGSGFISYDWPKPTATGLTEEDYPKQSYVKLFQPWGWVIGTGLYYDDLKEQMAQLRWTITGAVILLLLLTTFMTLMLLRNITRPLKALLRYSGEVAQGRLDAAITGSTSGEFQQLKQSTETMVKALQSSIQEARDKTEEAYREAKRSKEAEQALRKSEERLQLVMEATLDGIWDWDLRAGETYFSPGYFKMLGYAPEEFSIHSKSLQDLVHDEDRDEVLRINENCLKGLQDDFRLVYRMRAKNGQWRWILGRGRVVARDEQGRAMRLVGSHVDITESRRAEEERERLRRQLLQAQKMEAVATLAGGVAHDFNNMLQTVGGHTQLLLRGRTKNDPEYDKLQTIARAVERGGQLVQRLLLFGRKAEAQRRPLNLNQEVKDASKILDRTILQMISIELHPAEELWTVNADPAQIEQLLINLGVNAADAMPEGGKLTIATANVELITGQTWICPGVQPGRYVLLTVADTGCGMDSETLGKIYDPFFTTKEMGKGTGHGLASVYGIVQDHGGCITCDSKVGHGTTFRIYLPAMTEEDERDLTKHVPEQLPVDGSQTILVVDDEADLRDLTAEALQNFGYETLVASGGQEALELHTAHKERIDLVLLDLNMPGMSGQSCLQELLRMDPDVKVLILSGYTVNHQAEKLLRAGAAGFIGKPCQIRDLLTKVREVLDQKKA